MKHLPKHLRPRWRYLAVGIESWPDAGLSKRAFQRDLWYAAQNLLGDPGSADANLRVVRFEFADGEGEGIVRARRGETDAARAALACLDEVDGHDVGVRVRGISGTVRACSERYLGGAGRRSEQRHVAVEGEQYPASVRDGAFDVDRPDGFLGAAAPDFDS